MEIQQIVASNASRISEAGDVGMLITEPVAMRKDLALTVSRVPSRPLDVGGSS